MHAKMSHLKEVKGKPDQPHINTRCDSKRTVYVNQFILTMAITLFREHADSWRKHRAQTRSCSPAKGRAPKPQRPPNPVALLNMGLRGDTDPNTASEWAP